MSDETKRQLFQSIGQWVVVVGTGLLIYEDYTAFVSKGVMNALWQPGLQGLLSIAGIWGLSKATFGTRK